MATSVHREPETGRAPASTPVRADDDDATDAQVSDIKQYVTFIAGNEVFAVEMAPVQEIIRVPEVVRVPLAPPTLDGLANLRGQVLPIFSLRRIFGFDDTPHNDATRALVIDLGQPLGFVVDKVVSVVGVESARIEGVGSIEGTMDTALLSGIIKDVGGHAMIMVLDFAQLITREFSELATVTRRAGMTSGLAFGTTAEGDTREMSDELQLVSFAVAGQEYGIAIADVQEIVQMPETVVHVPRAQSHVVGVMTLRNRLLPLVSLRRMFSLPPQAEHEQERIVVLSLGAGSVGVVMDSVNEVLRVSRRHVDAMPNLFEAEGDLSEISQICRLDNGQRLVSIITAANLFRHSAIKEALDAVDDSPQDAMTDFVSSDDSQDDDEQVVVFRLGKEEFGVPIASVQEIVRVPDELTQVPKAPAFVEGVINLRGAVLPVIDLRRRLGLAAVERSDRQRVMVFVIDGMRTGYIVDSVAEVLMIHQSAIEAAPCLSGDQEALLSRVANLQQQRRMVQLLSPAHLTDGGQRRALASMAA